MNKYDLIGLIAALIVVVALPLYALSEPYRMQQAQAELRQEFVVEATALYVENCALCHGPTGEGIGVMPALNNPDLARADYGLLYNTIAYSPHGTAMSAWHVTEGSVLSGYQVESLVTLIQYADWQQVSKVADARGVVISTPAAADVDIAALEGGAEQDPHECVSCHEEPDMHAERFGLNCSRCHTLQSWKPALLTRHTFQLDHGDQGVVSCQTCHTQSYATHTCYECHDHTPEQMQEVHAQENLFEIENCVECHPTGEQGEARRLVDINMDEGVEGEELGGYELDNEQLQSSDDNASVGQAIESLGDGD